MDETWTIHGQLASSSSLAAQRLRHALSRKRCAARSIGVHDERPWQVPGRFGQDPFRPQFLAETSLISWTFRPQNVNDSAKKYERFGQINYIAAEMYLQN